MQKSCLPASTITLGVEAQPHLRLRPWNRFRTHVQSLTRLVILYFHSSFHAHTSMTNLITMTGPLLAICQCATKPSTIPPYGCMHIADLPTSSVAHSWTACQCSLPRKNKADLPDNVSIPHGCLEARRIARTHQPPEADRFLSWALRHSFSDRPSTLIDYFGSCKR
jgi:hypothetical protein